MTSVKITDIKDKKNNSNHTFYNQEHKNEFIDNNYTTGAGNVRTLFELTYDMEKALDKDLSNFNLFEVDNLLKSLNRGTLSSIATTVSMLRKYTDFSIKKGINKTRINYYRTKVGKDRMKKYVNPQSDKMSGTEDSDRLGRYISRDILHDIMDLCVNHQDAALFGVIFEGVKGGAHEEIRNLKKSDCDFDSGVIALTRSEIVNRATGEKKDVKRTIVIRDEQILNRLKRATKQRVYEVNNGDNITSKTPVLDLVDSEYVFRPTVMSKRDKLTAGVINSRINLISSIYRNDFINAQSLVYSGIIDQAKQMKEALDIEELEEEHYQHLVKAFNMSDSKRYWYSLKSKIGKYI